MITGLNEPEWLRKPPVEEVRDLIESGAKAILLFGPPRTGKTRLVDSIVPRNSETRCTIQIHDGWGYDHLMEGLKPDKHGNWSWKDGPLKEAIKSGKHFIVLEEVNRTAISQALGEAFSLIEDAYRGEENGITLRSGEKFWISPNVTFFMTMNNVDKSTEDIDDALMGRVATVEVPPRAQDLRDMLFAKDLPEVLIEKIAQLFAEIQAIYPLGHGYFAGLHKEVDHSGVIRHYKARVRPVLQNFLGALKAPEVAKIDNVANELFGGP